jgi:hypothetical protein
MNNEQKELAKRLGTYADAITAFSVVQSVAFAFALPSNKDFNTSVLESWRIALAGCGVAFLIYFYLIRRCHRGEDALLSKSSESALVNTWTNHVRCARYGLIGFALFVSVAAILITVFKRQALRTPSSGSLFPFNF